MHNFKELFLSKLPSPINRFAEDTITFAEWLNATFQKLIGLDQTIEAFRDINKANGKALDRIGDQFNQQRGSADDDFYRIMIRSKQATNMGNSTVNGLINMIARSLDIQPDKIRIESLRQYENGTLNDGEPLAIRISNIPLEWARSDFEQNYILERIKNGVAAGVRVDEVSFVDNSNAVLSVRGLTSATVTYEVKGEEQ